MVRLTMEKGALPVKPGEAPTLAQLPIRFCGMYDNAAAEITVMCSVRFFVILARLYGRIMCTAMLPCHS